MVTQGARVDDSFVLDDDTARDLAATSTDVFKCHARTRTHARTRARTHTHRTAPHRTHCTQTCHAHRHARPSTRTHACTQTHMHADTHARMPNCISGVPKLGRSLAVEVVSHAMAALPRDITADGIVLTGGCALNVAVNEAIPCVHPLRACVRACVLACVRACMRACVRSCVRARMRGWVGWVRVWVCATREYVAGHTEGSLTARRGGAGGAERCRPDISYGNILAIITD